MSRFSTKSISDAPDSRIGVKSVHPFRDVSCLKMWILRFFGIGLDFKRHEYMTNSQVFN